MPTLRTLVLFLSSFTYNLCVTIPISAYATRIQVFSLLQAYTNYMAVNVTNAWFEVLTAVMIDNHVVWDTRLFRLVSSF
jgi:hypothetical protein